MAAEIPGELLESLRCASASMADIRALAENLGALSPGQFEPVLRHYVATAYSYPINELDEAATAASSNPSLDRTRYGRPPWPGQRVAMSALVVGNSHANYTSIVRSHSL